MPASAATATPARGRSPATSLAIASGVPTTTKLRRSLLQLADRLPRTSHEQGVAELQSHLLGVVDDRACRCRRTPSSCSGRRSNICPQQPSVCPRYSDRGVGMTSANPISFDTNSSCESARRLQAEAELVHKRIDESLTGARTTRMSSSSRTTCQRFTSRPSMCSTKTAP